MAANADNLLFLQPHNYRINIRVRSANFLSSISFFLITNKYKMKAASLSDLRIELRNLPPEAVLEMCLRLMKYKKENKELVSYVLFDSDDEPAYVAGIKEIIDVLFKELNPRSLVQSKKSLQKILRTIARYAKYSGDKRTDIDLHIYFCQKYKDSRINFNRSVAIQNVYLRQITHIRKVIDTLHPDLQYDYEELMEQIDK
jgi:hypothetical protein